MLMSTERMVQAFNTNTLWCVLASEDQLWAGSGPRHCSQIWWPRASWGSAGASCAAKGNPPGVWRFGFISSANQPVHCVNLIHRPKTGRNVSVSKFRSPFTPPWSPHGPQREVSSGSSTFGGNFDKIFSRVSKQPSYCAENNNDLCTRSQN